MKHLFIYLICCLSWALTSSCSSDNKQEPANPADMEYYIGSFLKDCDFHIDIRKESQDVFYIYLYSYLPYDFLPGEASDPHYYPGAISPNHLAQAFYATAKDYGDGTTQKDTTNSKDKPDLIYRLSGLKMIDPQKPEGQQDLSPLLTIEWQSAQRLVKEKPTGIKNYAGYASYFDTMRKPLDEVTSEDCKWMVPGRIKIFFDQRFAPSDSTYLELTLGEEKRKAQPFFGSLKVKNFFP